MRKRESQQLYDKWFPLVIHIIDKHFAWATYDTSVDGFRWMRRAFDREDLKQVGWLALQRAKEAYDPRHESRSSFKTYAYRVIRNAVIEYVDSNQTPITTSRWSGLQKSGSEEAQRSRDAAVCYLNFSELAHKTRYGYASTDEVESVPIWIQKPDEGADPAEIIASQEFQTYCIEKLKANLTDEEWRILMLRYEGLTYREIGAKVSVTPETVRHLLDALNFKVHHILYKEVEEFGHGNNTDKGLSGQA